ncbi:MAG: NAD(P)H-hydrate epimerase [Saccharofermentans sp.]|nr:NAD(P)H-hydrate epimerase [Saccharofermentans sp.]
MVYETVSTKVMRESDAWTIEHLIPSKELMQRAGNGIYTEVVTLLQGWKAPVAIVCGKGNNAGDGFVVASLLQIHGIDCKIFLLYPDSFSEDGRHFFDICLSQGIEWEAFTEETSLDGYAMVVDCIFGTGIKGDARGLPACAINAINSAGASGAKVISADINSGLNGDTGLGDPAVISDLTVSIGTYKYGHFTGRSKEVMRSRTNVDIGIVIQGEIIYTED